MSSRPPLDAEQRRRLESLCLEALRVDGRWFGALTDGMA